MRQNSFEQDMNHYNLLFHFAGKTLCFATKPNGVA